MSQPGAAYNIVSRVIRVSAPTAEPSWIFESLLRESCHDAFISQSISLVTPQQAPNHRFPFPA